MAQSLHTASHVAPTALACRFLWSFSPLSLTTLHGHLLAALLPPYPGLLLRLDLSYLGRQTTSLSGSYKMSVVPVSNSPVAAGRCWCDTLLLLLFPFSFCANTVTTFATTSHLSSWRLPSLLLWQPARAVATHSSSFCSCRTTSCCRTRRFVSSAAWDACPKCSRQWQRRVQQRYPCSG